MYGQEENLKNEIITKANEEISEVILKRAKDTVAILQGIIKSLETKSEANINEKMAFVGSMYFQTLEFAWKLTEKEIAEVQHKYNKQSRSRVFKDLT